MTQAEIVTALCALHDFIRIYDPDEIHDFDGLMDSVYMCSVGSRVSEGLALGSSNISTAEKWQADHKRDRVAEEMWASYQQTLAEHH